jgi:transcriptional regulator
MYNIPYFKESDSEEVLRFIKAHSFAMLIGSSNNMSSATQVPFLFEEREGKLYLQGHIMRNTDHHKTFMDNDAALCVFTGAHTYVSARLYADPHTASTWNYMSVHVRGSIKFLPEGELVEILRKTTTNYEADTTSPASFENLPQDYIDRLIKAIIGFEIEVTSIENVFKLSQNKDRETFERITAKLSADGGEAAVIAGEMDKRKGKLFG